LAEAEAAFRELLERYPTAPEAAGALLGLGDIAYQQRKLLEARTLYAKMLEQFPQASVAMMAQERLGRVNMDLLFSPIVAEQDQLHEVKPGDSLAKIAKIFGTTVELLKRSNRLKSDTIHPGQKLKVHAGTFRVVVDKSQNTLSLLSNDTLFKVYPVSTGANNSTPAGVFTIVNKLEHPVWYKAGAVVPANSPENILGTRWMGWSKEGFGIHGTQEPQAIGQQVTAGCVRMLNPDVEELYAVVPQGAQVTVLD
jgi:lipoprotein-anchoring transpeptidase ErfK/SrfK